MISPQARHEHRIRMYLRRINRLQEEIAEIEQDLEQVRYEIEQEAKKNATS